MKELVLNSYNKFNDFNFVNSIEILHKLLHVQITHKHDYKMFLPRLPSYINKKLFSANLMAKKVLSRLNRIV